MNCLRVAPERPTERRCPRHPDEELSEVTYKYSEHGKTTASGMLYLCVECPEYLSDEDIAPHQGELGL